MHIAPSENSRNIITEYVSSDLIIVGGGMAGLCCAITAARAGVQVTLVQDRPVLGGNASSEVRMWILGATSHMGNNNRWAREGGVIDEILLENTCHNPQGNPVIFDSILLDKATREPNLRLLLDTTVHEVRKSSPDRIEAVAAYCSQNETRYELSAPLFCDASGDGVVGYLAGAAYRMGAEDKAEFGEKLAPDQAFGELLGHTIYFYSKDTGKPVKFYPPAFALQDITRIPHWRSFNAADYGNRLWWVEFGGRLDTIHDSEQIKWELWKIAYGIWNHIKNSGQFPEAENLTLEWMGAIPGKRESRRFEGDYMLCQQDLVEQHPFEDTVAHGGWAMDLHPADGIYSERPSCTQWHSRGVYSIPYRCLYSRNITNLFLAGRIISASHVAFGSTRTQATLAQAAQAVGMAAALCRRHHLLPRDLTTQPWIGRLQTALLRAGQFIPGFRLDDPQDLVQKSQISASSRLRLDLLPPNGPWKELSSSWGQMLPLPAGPVPRLTFWFRAAEPASLTIELRASDRPDNYTPDRLLETRTIELQPGDQPVQLDFQAVIDQPRYVFVCFRRCQGVAIRASLARLSGVLSITNQENALVSNFGRQVPSGDIGVEEFEFWTPQRRPAGHNLAVAIEPAVDLFQPENVANGLDRPTSQPNAWVADPADPQPVLTLTWDAPQTVRTIQLALDADFDNPLECFLIHQPETTMPFCLADFRIVADGDRVVAVVENHYQTLYTLTLAEPLVTRSLRLECLRTQGGTPAAVFGLRCYTGPLEA